MNQHLRNVQVLVTPLGVATVTCSNLEPEVEHQVRSLVRLAMRARAGSVEERIRSYVAVATGIIPAVVTVGHHLEQR